MSAANMADIQIPIDQINVGERIRKDMGDIDELARSIEENGLLQPILLDAQFTLIAGGRRLEAHRSLGRTTIPAVIGGTLADQAAYLTAERDENTCRKDMTYSEQAALAGLLMEIESKKARERQVQAGREYGRAANDEELAEARKAEGKSSGPTVPEQRARDQVGKALGVSGRSVDRMTAISKKASDESHPDHELAKELESGLDAGTETLNSADTKLRDAAKARKEAEEPSKYDHRIDHATILMKAALMLEDLIDVLPQIDPDVLTGADHEYVADALKHMTVVRKHLNKMKAKND